MRALQKLCSAQKCVKNKHGWNRPRVDKNPGSVVFFCSSKSPCRMAKNPAVSADSAHVSGCQGDVFGVDLRTIV